MKFKDARTGLDCDLNVNDRMGMHNSEMINEYCALSPVLRPLLFSIKEWAKPLGLNTPSGGLGVSVSFSSYALALMTIAFLQVRPLMLYSLLVLIRRSPGAGHPSEPAGRFVAAGAGGQ